MGGAFFETEVVEEFCCATVCCATVLSSDVGWKGYIFEGIELREEVVELEDKADFFIAEGGFGTFAEEGEGLAFEDDGALVRVVEGAEDLEECALASS